MPLPEDETEWKNLMIVFATAKGNVEKFFRGFYKY